MKFSEFYGIVYPADLKKQESGRGMVWKLLRHLGAHGAYLFYKLRINANIVDALRVALSLLAFCFFLDASREQTYAAIIGAFLLYVVVFLDFVDGAVARAFEKSTCFGKELDGLPNALSRSVLLIMFGIFTGNKVFIILSALTSYILTNFYECTIGKIPDTQFFKLVKFFYRRLLSVVFMLIFLPTAIVLCMLLSIPLDLLGYSVSAVYILLAAAWICICVLKE